MCSAKAETYCQTIYILPQNDENFKEVTGNQKTLI